MKKPSTLKTFFSLLKPSESIAIAAVLGVVALVGITMNVKACKTYRVLKSANEEKNKEQNSWLSREKDIDKHFQDVIDDIRSRKRIDRSELMTLVQNAAKRLSLKHTINGIPETVNGKFFSFNKVSITLSDAYFADILAFDNAVEIPDYALCIDSMSLDLSGAKLRATISLSALDIKADQDPNTLVARILGSYDLDEKLIMWNGSKDLVE
ncbi:MAG: hypothetical protein LW808_000660 [Verrucomicrobiota bacterium]|nr:hypothetical protein [Opitutales bacterium]UPA28571.1 MAG: hypothetical protein LW808_000660 [Verrucomicrobiota bacterium]